LRFRKINAQGSQLVQGVGKIFLGPAEAIQLPDQKNVIFPFSGRALHLNESRAVDISAGVPLVSAFSIDLPSGSFDKILQI